MVEKEHSKLSDGDLFERLRSGDEQAWEVFVERFSRLLHAIPFRYFGDDGVIEDVEDIVQMTWLKLIENLENINEPERLSAWLVTTSRRNGTGMTRAQSWKREVSLDFNDDGDLFNPKSIPSAEEELIEVEESKRISESLRELEERDQKLIDLLFLDPNKPSYLEIAEEFGMASGGVGSTRKRCLKRLRRIFERGE